MTVIAVDTAQQYREAVAQHTGMDFTDSEALDLDKGKCALAFKNNGKRGVGSFECCVDTNPLGPWPCNGT